LRKYNEKKTLHKRRHFIHGWPK